MKTLRELYREHDGKVSDKWSHYLDAYERRFAEFRDQPVSLLEIGVQNGGSLEIWAKYFPKATEIVGCDINPDCRKLRFDDPRIRVVVGDANTDEVHRQIIGAVSGYDIIIDDGSHRSGDIIKSFALYFPCLREGGVYVAEDLHCSYWASYQGGLYDPYSSMAFFKRLADVINQEHWGVAKSSLDVLKGFFNKYDVVINPEILELISSVEISNSVAFATISSKKSARLGPRIIAGQQEVVVGGILPLGGRNQDVPDESGNSWSTIVRPPDEEWEELRAGLAERDAQLAERDSQLAGAHSRINAMESSLSWRMTKPLRSVYGIVMGLRHAWGNARRYVQHNGVAKSIPHTLHIIRRHGRYAFAPQHAAAGMPDDGRNDYAEWIRRYDTIDDHVRAKIRDRIAQMVNIPLISVVMPTYNANHKWLAETIDSVRNQVYPHWELCIADDASTDPDIRPLLEKYAREDARIKVVFREKNGHISAASNSALALASGEWIALLDHDDLLREHALYWVARTINENPDTALIYSDEDKLNDAGQRYSPYFKPDWNPDLFYSHNLITHLGVYRKDILDRIGGVHEGFEGAQDYDLALRFIEQITPDSIVHIPRILYHWRVHAQSTADSSADAKPYAMLAGERAINEHFRRSGKGGRVELVGYGYRARYDLPENRPLVTMIIPVHNGYDIFRKCLESILQKTSYTRFEVLIVDNRSSDQKLLDYLVHAAGLPGVEVVRDDGPFNYSAINNRAVARARGDYVLLMNSDVEVIHEDWLDEMMSLAIQPGVGAVGARLWYPNDTLQHGGVILGIGGVAGHSHKGFHRGHPGYLGRASLIHTCSAVTGACVLFRRELYLSLGGLNEQDLGVALNDVDICLRLGEAGYRTVWTPYAELYHHESLSRGYEDTPEKQERFERERAYMKSRWGELLVNDPAYNPNLTLDHEDFSLAWPPRVEIV